MKTNQNDVEMTLFFFQMLNSIRDCFVTGKWDEGQDAATLLKEDGKRGKENQPNILIEV